MIETEIQRLRDRADELAGSAVMTLVEMRAYLSRIVRCTTGELNGERIRTSDSIAAIRLDNDLAGSGSEAGANDALGALLKRITAQ